MREGETGGDAHSLTKYCVPNDSMNECIQLIQCIVYLCNVHCTVYNVQCIQQQAKNVLLICLMLVCQESWVDDDSTQNTKTGKKIVNRKVELTPSDHSFIFILCALFILGSCSGSVLRWFCVRIWFRLQHLSLQMSIPVVRVIRRPLLFHLFSFEYTENSF